MKKIRNIAILVIILSVFAGGCSSKNKRDIPLFKDAFKTRQELEKTAKEAESPETGSEEPIVRIIKGTSVDGPEDAAKILEESGVQRLAGPYTRIRSIILRDVPVQVISEMLTDMTGTNVVATGAVAKRPVSVYLKNVTVCEALDALCRLNNIWYREDRGVMTLMTREEFISDTENRQSDQTRAFFIRYTNAADMAKVIQSAMGDQVYLNVIDDEKIYGHIDPDEDADVGAGESESPELRQRTALEGGIGKTAPLANLQPLEAVSEEGTQKKESDKPLLAILTVFKRNNCILARSLDGRLLNEMEKIIATLDTPTSQVLLEIRILQLTLDDGFESFFEFDWGDAINTVGVLGLQGGSATSVNYLYSKDKIDARLAYYKTNGRSEIVSTPFLMAANNSKVEFFVGEETPLRDDVTATTVNTEEGKVITVFEVDINREELGTDVEMTTFINEDDTVTLEFEATIDSAILNYSTVGVVNEQTGEIVEFPLDGTSKSEIKSILTAKSGQSIAIGGIIKETLALTDNKVPILGDIPLLGFFFKEIEKTRKKTETVIVLTPHVVDHPAHAGAVTNEFMGRKSSHQRFTRGRENILAPFKKTGKEAAEENKKEEEEDARQ